MALYEITIKTVHINYMYLFICFNCGALVIVYSALNGTYIGAYMALNGALYMAYIWRFICAAIKNHVSAYIPFNILHLTL